MPSSDIDQSKLPSPWKIACYWGNDEQACRRHPRAWEFVIDLGEPACFACGWYRESWVLFPILSAEQAWNRAKGLQRCHLTPRALGGPASVDNLVLLCQSCHAAAPDHRDPSYMLEWMVARPTWLMTMVNELLAELVAVGLSLERLNSIPWRRDAWIEILRKQYANCGTHFGKFSAATRAAVIKEAVAEYEIRHRLNRPISHSDATI